MIYYNILLTHKLMINLNFYMKFTFIILLFYCLPAKSQEQPIEKLITAIGYKDFKLGMSFKDFNNLEKNIYQATSIGNNTTYGISENYALDFLGLTCDSYFAFNGLGKLSIIAWQIDNALIEIDGINNTAARINNLIGMPTVDTSFKDPELVRKLVWRSKSISLTFFYRKTQSRSFLSYQESIIPKVSVANKTPNAKTLNIDQDRNGKGNNTFVVTLSNLERIILPGISLKTFESSLPEWSSEKSNNSVSYSFNEKTKEHDIPNYKLVYTFYFKNKYYTCKAEISNLITQKIKHFEVSTVLNGEEIAKFKTALSRNYYLNENLTDIFRHPTYNNKNNNVFIIFKRDFGHVTIEIAK